MDMVADNSHDKLIEDYLFSGYRPSTKKSAFELDQQFAKPIVDEDIFGAAEEISLSNQNEAPQDHAESQSCEDSFVYGKDPIITDMESDVIVERNPKSPDKIFEDESNDVQEIDRNTPTQPQPNPQPTIEEIFLDDYSSSSQNVAPKAPKNNENTCPKTYQTTKQPAPQPLSPVLVKKKRMQEEFLRQAQAFQVTPPKRSKADCNEDETIELFIEQHKLVSNADSKFMFGKLVNKKRVADDNDGTPAKRSGGWQAYKDSLRKKMCAKKRKIWDSLLAPAGEIDDEEDIVEMKMSQANGADKTDADEAASLGPAKDDDDGGVEALEREEIESEDEEVARSGSEAEDDEVVDDYREHDSNDEDVDIPEESDPPNGAEDRDEHPGAEDADSDDEVVYRKLPKSRDVDNTDKASEHVGTAQIVSDDSDDEVIYRKLPRLQESKELDEDADSLASDDFDDLDDEAAFIDDNENDGGAVDEEVVDKGNNQNTGADSDSDDSIVTGGGAKYNLNLDADSDSEQPASRGMKRKPIIEDDD